MSDIIAVMKVIAPLDGALSFLVIIVIIGIFMYQEKNRCELDSAQRKADVISSEKKDAQILELFNRLADQSSETSKENTKVLNVITGILMELSKREELKIDQMKRLLENQNVNDKEIKNNLYEANTKLDQIGKKLECVATKVDIDHLSMALRGCSEGAIKSNKIF